MSDRFALLPHPRTTEGKDRLTGVEIEFAGLPEDEVCAIVADVLGGTPNQTDSAVWEVPDTRIGRVQVYLDIFLRDKEKTSLRDAVLKAGRGIVPVEVVSEPLDRDGLIALDELRAALCAAGAKGSASGILNGFGVHLNPEVRGSEPEEALPPFVAYALCEEHLRHIHPIDATRRLLPFTDPYPPGLVAGLVELGPEPRIDNTMDVYLGHASSRNYGLDMLPLFAELAPRRVEATMGEGTSPRPTFHFRLPDCLIDDPDWSLDAPWRLWHCVETIAATDGLIAALMDGWRAHHGENGLLRETWATRTGRILADHGIMA